MFTALATLKLSITDDSGFLAVVNTAKYASFVDDNWEFEQLMKHFADEMNKGALIIWATGMENIWNVSFSSSPSDRKPFSELTKTIEVTDGRLFLTNYEDLTMAAQFRDERVPSKHNADLQVSLDNGIYAVTIRQMFSPNGYSYDAESNISFEVVIQPDSYLADQKVGKVFWMEE